MKEKIIKAKAYTKIMRRKDEPHLAFHEMVIRRYAEAFGEPGDIDAITEGAPEKLREQCGLISEQWSRMAAAVERQKRKMNHWRERRTPELREAEQRREDIARKIAELADKLEATDYHTENHRLGIILHIQLSHWKMIGHEREFYPDIQSEYFCRVMLDKPEYRAAVEAGIMPPLVEQVKEATEECERLWYKRMDEQRAEIPELTDELRKRTDEAYLALIEATNDSLATANTLIAETNGAEVAVGTARRLAKLINALNGDIARLEEEAKEQTRKKKEAAEQRKLLKN